MLLQKAFSSLPAPDSGDYSKVKAAVLKSYELVPEAYRQRFRSWRKGDKSHLEFARELGTHFHRWCEAVGVTDFGGLCDLIVLEQFKNLVPERLAMYISEKKVSTAAEAAALADEYFLTHKRGRGDFPACADGPVGGVSSWDRPGVQRGVRGCEYDFCLISVTKKDIGKKIAPYVKHILRMVADL